MIRCGGGGGAEKYTIFFILELHVLWAYADKEHVKFLCEINLSNGLGQVQTEVPIVACSKALYSK